MIQCLDATPPLENKAHIILSFELISIEKESGFLFFFFFFTMTSIDQHLTVFVKCTEERCLLLRTPGMLHPSLGGHMCPQNIQECKQITYLVVYLTKQPTSLKHIKDDFSIT